MGGYQGSISSTGILAKDRSRGGRPCCHGDDRTIADPSVDTRHGRTGDGVQGAAHPARPLLRQRRDKLGLPRFGGRLRVVVSRMRSIPRDQEFLPRRWGSGREPRSRAVWTLPSLHAASLRDRASKLTGDS